MSASNQVLLQLFYLSCVAVVTLVSFWLNRRYRHHFFTNWAWASCCLFLASFTELINSALGERPFALFVAGSLGITLTAFFFVKVGYEVRGSPSPAWLPGAAALVFLTSVALFFNFSFEVAVGPPVLAATFAIIWLGIRFWTEPLSPCRHVPRLLAVLLILKGLWALSYPVLVDTAFEWTGYWLDGVFQLLIGVAMLVFVLERSTEELHCLVEGNLNHSFFLANPRGEISSWNSGARRLHGFAEAEVVGKPLSMLLTDARPGVELIQEALQSPAGAVEREGLLRRKGAASFWGRVAVSAIRDHRDNPRGISVLVNDLSDRRALEEERARLSAAVRQSVEGIVLTDGSGRIEYVNPAFERSHGLAASEVLGLGLQELELAACAAGLTEAIEHQEPWYRRISRREAGRDVVEDLVLSPVRDAAGTVTLFVLSIHDVSRETALQEQVQHARKMEELGRLSGGMAHEFGNLLTIIVSYNHLLKKRAETDEEVRKSVDAIARASNRAERLIRQLLTLCRQDAKVLQTVEVNGFLSQFVGMVRRIVREDIEICASFDERAGSVRLDPEQLEQALMNLVLNARDAMPDGGTLTIETRACAAGPDASACGGQVEIVVRDTGCGMSDETRARVFEPFFTTKPVGRGTGIGLAVVDAFVREASGSIAVESELGRGTTFRLRFPRDEAAAREDIVSAEAFTVLVVDDEPVLGQLVRKILEQKAFRTLGAASATEALELSKRHEGTIDLLLTDVTMPGISGGTLAGLLQDVYPAMKTLFMSGHTDDPTVRRVCAEGAAFIAKPFEPEQLLKKVSEIVGEPPGPGRVERARAG